MKINQDIDYLVRATAEAGSVRALATRTTILVEEARMRHKTYPTVTAALGRLLTAGILTAALLKGKETLTIRVLSNGPIGGIVVVGNAKGEVKGYVKNTEVHVPLNPIEKFDVAMAVGAKGTLYVSYDYELKEPYTGSVPLVSGEIAKDLAYYFAKSEQIPSIVALGVLVGWNGVLASGGYLIQLLPDTNKENITIKENTMSKENIISKIEENIKTLPEISKLIFEEKCTPEEILECVLHGLDMTIHGKNEVYFKCHCSNEKVKDILASLPKRDIRQLILQEGQAEARCHFCNATHTVSKETLKEIITSRDI